MNIELPEKGYIQIYFAYKENKNINIKLDATTTEYGIPIIYINIKNSNNPTKKYRALIDTGAKTSIMTSKLALELNMPKDLDIPLTTIIGATGDTLKVNNYLGDLIADMAGGGITGVAQMSISDTKKLYDAYDIVLGANFLCKYTLIMSYDYKIFRLYPISPK